MATTSTKKNTAPKAPQDRKPKAVEFDVTKTPGWNLLKPLSEIPVWEQTDIMDLFYSASDDEKEEADGTRSFDLGVVGKLAKAMMVFAIDEAEYLKFVSGAGAMERAMGLASAWIGQMGESKGSEN